MAIYVVDSNFFIEAHRKNYPLDVAASFWNKLRELAAVGAIISIDKVKNEIFGHEDALETWCIENLPEDFFKDSAAVMNEYRQVTAWAISRNNHYMPNALNEFLDADEADAFIIAYALTDPGVRIVVTQEISEPGRRNKVKIPDVCLALDVHCVNTVNMFRQLNESF